MYTQGTEQNQIVRAHVHEIPHTIDIPSTYHFADAWPTQKGSGPSCCNEDFAK